MTIHMYKVNFYMKYQSAVEILSILAIAWLLPEKAFRHCIRQQYNTKTSTVTRHFPFLLQFLKPTWLVEYLYQVSLKIYGRFFLQWITLCHTLTLI